MKSRGIGRGGRTRRAAEAEGWGGRPDVRLRCKNGAGSGHQIVVRGAGRKNGAESQMYN
ncbi:hypothetical protein [Paenibacillus sp. YSY-4.3]